jgi:hypothetical protein
MVRSDRFIIPCPWLQVKDLTQAASAQHNINLEFGPADGARLKKIYWTPFTTADTLNNAYDCDNRPVLTGILANGNSAAIPATFVNNIAINNVKINNFITKLDNQNLSGVTPVNCSLQEDYFLMRRRQRGSSILSADEHYYNWTYIEDFTASYSKITDPQLVSPDLAISGLSLDMRHTYNIQAVLPATNSLKHIVSLVFIRSLKIPAIGVPTQGDFM